jgi:hypothetical protein
MTQLLSKQGGLQENTNLDNFSTLILQMNVQFVVVFRF